MRGHGSSCVDLLHREERRHVLPCRLRALNRPHLAKFRGRDALGERRHLEEEGVNGAEALL